MTAPTHVYVTAHGSFATGPWVGEAAQFGLRLPFIPTIGGPVAGETFTPASNGDVVTDQGTSTSTHGTLTRTFDFRIGTTGSNENYNDVMQMKTAEDLWTYLDSIKTMFYSAFKWTHVKQSPVGANGRAIGYSSTYTFSTALAGTASSLLPPQVAIAVSLRAPIVGRRGRGRIYLPAVGATQITTDGQIATSLATTLRTNTKALIDALQDPPGTPSFIPIVSVMSADSATAVRPSQVRTGNRLDTIRSRREQVPETYTALDL